MKTRSTRLFLELNFSAFLAQCFSLVRVDVSRLAKVRLVQLGLD